VLARRGSDIALRFDELVGARLHATAAGDEIWLAMRLRRQTAASSTIDFATHSFGWSLTRPRRALGTTPGLAFWRAGLVRGRRLARATQPGPT
jgi:hypothetical protein